MARRQRRRRQERRQEHAKQRGWRTRHSLLTGAGLAVTATLGVAGGAQAAGSYYYYVGSTADTSTATDCDVPSNTDCTLRDAINASNNNNGYADTIYFSSTISGTPIVLTGDLPTIDDPVYIVGNGPGATTISGDESHRIFDINLTTAGDTVGIYGMSLIDGYVDGNGAAIHDTNSTLHVGDSVLTGNAATGKGGAIYEYGDAYGGYHTQIAYTTVAANHAGNRGGGMFGDISLGTIGTSTISGNSADGIGGGVGSYFPSFMYSDTVAGNSALYAGGVYTGHNGNDYGYLYTSIVANNTAPGEDPDLGHDFFTAFDLIRTPDTATLATPPSITGPNILGVDPQLGGLGNNGGDTPTLKPAASSPVVDQGLSGDADDQRGSPRPIDNPNKPNAAGGDGGDMGSVELTLAEGPQAPTPTPTPTPTFNLKKAIKHCKKKFRHKAKQRKKCIKKARKKARASASSSPWRKAAHRWASAHHTSSEPHHAFRTYQRP